MEFNLSKEEKQAILESELRNWLGTKFRLQLRYRVHKDLGNAGELKTLEEQLVKCEQAIDLLRAEMDQSSGDDGAV